MGTGCEKSAAPAESNVVPRPVFMPAEQVQPTTRVSGVAYDPEAFFINLANCGGRSCPIPPFLSEGIPLYLRSAVRGAQVLAFDVEQAQPGPVPGPPAAADGAGIWVLPNVPARFTTPFFTLATGAGVMPDPSEAIGPPLPPVAPTEYLPTLTLRPIFTGPSGTCVGQEAAHIGKNGILEAVAKHLSATGPATTVGDLINPQRFWGTNVFWFYEAGNPVVRGPADGISLEVDIKGGPHRQLAIDWAPPGVLPPFLNQSTRGFYVTNASISPLGVYVVLLPVQGPPPTEIKYLIKDTLTRAQALRPWQFPPLPGGIGPGVVSFTGIQMQYPINPLNPPPVPPPYICLPPPSR
jgi:hypothetical protein